MDHIEALIMPQCIHSFAQISRYYHGPGFLNWHFSPQVLGIAFQKSVEAYTVTRQKSTQIILYLPQVPENSYHINMVICKYSIYIFDMNMRSGCHALFYVGETEKIVFLEVYKYFQ